MATPHSRSNMVFKQIAANNDVLIAAMVIAIVIIIVLPIPPALLDILLVINLTISLVIMLTTMFTTQPLQFSVFPSLLLVMTLFRLSLNISSTKLILNYARAGDVIKAFGDFVVGGNYVVGFIVFIIITVIQFVVITNGAGRVAEVAARFTLDAMPGKQMSIDADLNAGLITEQEAKDQRKRLQREADFFGAMDGASKFVKGDAIAGIVIALVNILGGFVIGAWQLNLTLIEALQTYTILTVGDGLVSQIPALLISTGTGILVTRAGSDQSFGSDLASQLTGFPKVIALVAALLLVLGLIPGLPTMPFVILAVGAGYAAYLLFSEERQLEEIGKEKEMIDAKKIARQPENVVSLLQVDPLEVEIGYQLIPLTDEKQGGDLLDRLAAVRRQCAMELGILVRPIRIRDNLQLTPNQYVLKIRGVEVAQGDVMPGYHLAMNPGNDDVKIEGIETTEPTFGLAAWWITEQKKEEAEIKGYTVVDADTVLITHLTEFIKSHAHELMGRQEVKELLDMVKESTPALIEDLVPDLINHGEIQKVLQNLLKEQIPVRDMVGILECIADHAGRSKDIDYLTEVVRQSLSRVISQLYTHNGKLNVLTLDHSLEELLVNSIQQTQEGMYPIVDPQTTQRIFDNLSTKFQQVNFGDNPPIVLCSARSRLAFRRLIERYMPNLVVLSLNELTPNLDVIAVGVIELNEN
ncbi:flagellar biosynthesis protein FlhA [Metallumcola ferriviriculae]|uniref:Flagellar biosynthesis protein FlhA n=1 Tax=Metallumcola ferriviriculae TaxID=3039180 RepID=A0AAU0UTI0_9FIRM|nr:flagellar biosynthesis protein FlhA [Desulfitibacteraceae bacterium MK1]